MNTKNTRIIIGTIVALVIVVLVVLSLQKPNTEEATPDNTSTTTGQSISAYIQKGEVTINGESESNKKVSSISAVKTENISPSNVIVSWSTAIPVKTEIYFSTTPPAPNVVRQIIRDTKPKTAHAVELTNLIPNTTYYFSILSVNAEQKISTTTVDGIFKTIQK